MIIFLFILGIIIGFAGKASFDEYHYYRNNQEKATLKMEDILTQFRAIELNKKID